MTLPRLCSFKNDFGEKAKMNNRNHNALLLISTFLILVLTVPSVGQVVKGSISGTVVDPQNAVVSGAKVKAADISTGTVFDTTSDSAGLFRFNLIPAGTYKLEISAQGFQTSVQNNVQVTAGADSGVGAVELKIGGGETTVDVNGAAQLVETTQAQVTNTFSETILTNFAGIQENQGLDNLALYVPGVSSARDQNFSNTNGGGGFAVNGIRGRNNDQEIDGQNNNDNSVAGPAAAQTDPEFVGQYVIITNNFGPEYGRNAGSVVNVITKGGTNAWHGNVYANENNSILNSLTSTQKLGATPGLTHPPRANDEFGGFTIGGPLVKNKAFFFFGFDQEILSTGTLYSTGQLTPTPAGLATLAGCFPSGASANAIAALSKFGPYGISAGNPTPGNLTSSTVAGCSGVQLGTVSRVLPTPEHAFNWVTREDVTLGSNDALSARYLFNRNNFFNTQDNGAAGYVVNVPALSQAVLLSETHNFSQRMVNEVRFGFDRLNVQFGGNTIGTEPTTANILNAVSQVSFLSPTFLGYGVNTALPQGRVVNTWQAQDNWNYVLGNHSLKAGVNWTYQQSPNTFLPGINGQYFFSDLNAYILNTPSFGFITSGPPELGLKEYDTFFYFGDDWKIARNLTLNLGVTYSYFGSPYNQLHDLGVTQQQGANPVFNPALPLSVTTPPSVPAYTKAIGPSFGFAYSPRWGGFLTGHDKTTIRGGYRVSYDPAFNNILLNNYGGAPSVLSTTVAAPPLPAVPTGPNVRPLLLAGLPLGTLDPRTLGEVTVPQDFRPDQVQSWSLGIERELTKNSAFEIRYVGNHASQLLQTVNANPFVADLKTQFPNLVPAGVTPCAASQLTGPGAGVALGREFCNEGILLSRNNTGFSNYQAIQTEFRANNLFHQLTVRADYTHSKTLDNVSEIFSTFGGGTTFAIAQDPLNTNGGEYSFSGLDIPNTFSLIAVEELPFFKEQHGILGHLLGGWTMSASYVWESGQAFTPETIVFPQLTEGGDFFDNNFNAQFNNGLTAARPFIGSLSAPANSVGIFAGDACTIFEQGAAGTSLCSVAPTQLLSLNAINSTPQGSADFTATTVSKNQVRYIANTGVAESVFGTPFGNAPRNIGRDAPLNFLNASLTKRVKVNERASFEFRFTALNALNHSNFTTVNPFIENAGSPGTFGNAFAVPQLTGDSIPGSNLAASRRFYVGGTFRF
jgi:hypothetical protein